MSSPRALYLHIPFCRRRCGYCSFVSFSGREHDIPRYLRALEGEIGLRGTQAATLDSVYIGGGTPSLLAPGQVDSLLATVRRNFVISESAEISMEANPGTVNGELIKCLLFSKSTS